jgi:hypothetical protein
MKPALKYSLIMVSALALVLPALYFGAVLLGLQAHAKHDAIIFGGKRVQEAVSDYAAKYGKPPQRLEQLVPDFLETVPAIPEISRMDYRVSNDGTSWTLDFYRTNRNVLMIYRRTNSGLSSEDAKRKVETEDGCYVLKAD